jgi:hypothetical protein
LGAIVVFLVACEENAPAPTEPAEITMPVYSFGRGFERLHATHLSGREEVFTPATPDAPTPADSRAIGLAVFREKHNGDVEFVVATSKIHNVNQAHIHCGAAGVNGPVRMWLFPVIGPTGAAGPNGSGPRAGVLASGRFSPAGVVCPASAVGTDMPLIEAMRAGLAYVNVHTNDGVAPTNTGPGDFPGGEIRGQLDRPGQH